MLDYRCCGFFTGQIKLESHLDWSPYFFFIYLFICITKKYKAISKSTNITYSCTLLLINITYSTLHKYINNTVKILQFTTYNIDTTHGKINTIYKILLTINLYSGNELWNVKAEEFISLNNLTEL